MILWRGRLLGRALNRGNRPLVEAAVEATGARTGQSVADVGFGGGVGLRMLLDRVGSSGRVYGVDVSTTMVDQARRSFAKECAAGTVSVLVGSMSDLPLPDDALDAVITVNTVYFVEDLVVAFGELARALRPGGRLVVALGDPEEMARMPVTAYGFRLRPLEELVSTMTAAGLSAVRAERVVVARDSAHVVVGTA